MAEIVMNIVAVCVCVCVCMKCIIVECLSTPLSMYVYIYLYKSMCLYTHLKAGYICGDCLVYNSEVLVPILVRPQY